MRLTKIYTKVGDKGFTHLATGESVFKSDLRIHAYGTIDELNSFLGLLTHTCNTTSFKNQTPVSKILQDLERIQNELFDMGGELSFAKNKLDYKKIPTLSESSTKYLECKIDEMNEELSPLKNFILPGGHVAVSTAHVVRTVCRRAERSLVHLHQTEGIRLELLTYINRLSDYFFVLSRYFCHLLEYPEKLWQQKK